MVLQVLQMLEARPHRVTEATLRFDDPELSITSRKPDVWPRRTVSYVGDPGFVAVPSQALVATLCAEARAD